MEGDYNTITWVICSKGPALHLPIPRRNTESTKLKKAAGDAFWAAVDFFIPPAWRVKHSRWIFHSFLEKSTNSTHGKRASFSQNSQKWRPFFENVCFSWTFVEFVRFSWTFTDFVRFFMEFWWIIWKIYKLYPWETCIIFAEFANMTPFFWKCMCFVNI